MKRVFRSFSSRRAFAGMQSHVVLVRAPGILPRWVDAESIQLPAAVANLARRAVWIRQPQRRLVGAFNTLPAQNYAVVAYVFNGEMPKERKRTERIVTSLLIGVEAAPFRDDGDRGAQRGFERLGRRLP